MQVVVRPHLLSDREQAIVEDIDYGMSIAEVVSRLEMVNERVREMHLVVNIDGETLPRSQWQTRCLQQDDKRVEFAVVLQGGGGGNNKSILALVAVIALSIVAGPLAGALTAAPTATAGAGVLYGIASAATVKAGIMLVGTLLMHAIFAPPRTDPSRVGDISPTYTFSGQSNIPRRFSRLPRIYGKYRYVADLAAMPYTVNSGDDSYIYCLYSFGYGPLVLEDFRIGENPLSNYQGVDMRVHANFTNANQLELYKNDVWQDSVSFELRQPTPVVVSTQEDTEQAIVDISFPQGLLQTDSEANWLFETTDMTFEYRPIGGGSFTPIALYDISRGAADVQQGRFYTGGQKYPGVYDPYETRWVPDPIEGSVRYREPGWSAGETIIHGWTPSEYDNRQGVNMAIQAGSHLFLGPYEMVVQSVVPWEPEPGGGSPARWIGGKQVFPVTVTLQSGLPGNLPVAGDDQALSFMYKLSSYFTNGEGTNTMRLREKEGSPFVVSASMRFPAKGQYEIRITKVEADHGDDDVQRMWRRYVTSIRSIKSQPPIVPDVPMTVVELVIKATGQLNGTIEQFSAVATSVLRQWNGSSWIVGVSRNPAWIYLDMLQGTANVRPLPDARIDLTTIRQWAVYCDEVVDPFEGPTGTCDCVVDKEYTLWTLLQNVATTGRASPTMKDNKYSVLIDTAERTPVQMFTPRNSTNLQSTRTYIDEPHALRVKWIDPLKNYTAAEQIVYNTGRDATNTTVFEELVSFGMTRSEQILRWGRYMLAQGKLRQERFTIDVDIENIVCTRGDLVMVAHDVIEVGGDATRIVEVDGNRLFVDAPPSMDIILDPTAYGVRVRRSDGYVSAVLSVIAVGNDGEFDYIDVTGDLTGIIADNLLVLGPKSEVVGQYVVDRVMPSSDFSATISLEEYAPGVYDAEFEGLEDVFYKPQGSGGTAPAVTHMVVKALVTYVEGKALATLHVSWRPAQGWTYQPDDYRVWMLTPNGNEEFQGITNALFWEAGPYDLTTLNGYEFIFRVRPFYGARGLGPITEASVVVEYAPTQPPKLMDFFDVVDLPAGARRYVWSFIDNNVPVNVVGIHVRYLNGNVVDPVWGTGVDVVGEGNYTLQNGTELHVPPGAGTFTFMARTIDAKGQLSTGMYILVKDLSINFSTDLTPPPTPTGFAALGGYGVVFFDVDDPLYEMGGGHDYTQVYVTTAASQTFEDAVPFTSFKGTNSSAGAESAKEYWFWATWVSKAGVQSLVPAGPVHAETAIDVDGTLDALEGQITEEHLHQDLGSRIDLVDAPATTPGSVNDRLQDEAVLRANADAAEAQARADADAAEALARTQEITTKVAQEAVARDAAVTAEANARIAAINQEVIDRNAAIAVETQNRTDAIAAEAAARGAAITNEATIRQAGDDSLAQQISLITAGVAGGFDPGVMYYFDANVEGWTAVNAALTWEVGSMKMDYTAASGQLFSPAALAITGSTYPIVKARVIKVDGKTVNPTWIGRVYYSTSGHGMSASYYKEIPDPGGAGGMAEGEPYVIEWDMTQLTAGGADWANSTITQIRIDLGGDIEDIFTIDWVAVGRNAPGASVAALAQEQQARIQGDNALAANITALTARVGDTEADILEEQTVRANADTAISNSVTALTARVTTAEGAIVTEQTVRANADTALTNSFNSLAAKTEGGWDTGVHYGFDTDTEQWQGAGATLTWQANGTLRYAATGTTNYMLQAGAVNMNLPGIKYPIVRMRLTRVAGTGWMGRLMYTTPGHGQAGPFLKTVPNPNLAVGQSAVIEWDMADIPGATPPTDWIDSIINRVRIDIGSTATDQFDVDWISFGRKSPSASIAGLASEQTARVAGDTANASNVTALTATVGRTRGQTMVETWTGTDPLANWDMTYATVGEVTLTTDAEVPYTVVQAGDNASGSDQAWLTSKDNIPYDPDKLYKLTARVKRLSGNGQVHIGLSGIQADGVSYVSYNGTTAKPGPHYIAAISTVPPLGVWTTYTGYVKGWADPATATPSADPRNPQKMHKNVRFVRPFVAANLQNQQGTTLIGKVDFSEEGSVDLAAADILVEQTTRANADSALASQLTAISAKTEGEFDTLWAWNFDTTLEGWTAANATIAWQTGGFMRGASTTTSALYRTPTGLAINGALYNVVRLRVTRVAGTGFGTARLFYSTVAGSQTVHGETISYYKLIPNDPALANIGGTAVFDLDMAALTAGGDDWVKGIIGQIRIDMGSNVPDSFDFDWVAVGRKAPAASHAMMVAEQTARTSADTANANNITALTASTTLALSRMRNQVQEQWITATAQTDNWIVYSGTPEMVIATDAGYVGNVLSVGNNVGNDGLYLLGKDLIPYDATKLYRVRGDFKRVDGSTGYINLGLVGYAADGTTMVNYLGTNSNGGQYFHAALGAVPAFGSWASYTGYTKGYGSPNGETAVSADPLVPRVVHQGVRYVRLAVLVNYPSAAGTTLVGRVSVDYADQDATAANLVIEQNARTTADTAFTNQITSLTATVTTGFSRMRDQLQEQWITPTAHTDNWMTLTGNMGELSITTDAEYVGQVLQGGNNAGDDVIRLGHRDLIAFDPNKLYRSDVDIKRVAGTQGIYVGFLGYAADGTTLVAVNGTNVLTSQHYQTATGAPALGAWNHYTGYSKGWAAAGVNGDAAPSTNPLAPAKFHAAVRYIRPMLYLNYTGQPGITLVGRYSVAVAEQDVVAANLVTEQTTRANADTAISSNVTALTARVTTAEGNITSNAAAISTEQTARANADTALSNQITALSATVTGADTRSRVGMLETWITATAHTDNWVPTGPGEMLVTTEGGMTGSVLSVGNNTGNDLVSLTHKDLIPFDPGKLYRISVPIKRTNGTGTVTIGYVGYAADGTTMVNKDGANSASSQHFHAANAADPGTGGWVTYVGYTKGHAATGDFSASSDPLAPKKMHANVRYLKALVMVNGPTATGTTYIGRVEVTSGEADVVQANLSTEQTTRANADTAISSNVTALTARVTTAEGDINAVEAGLATEQTTRADADTAISSNVTALTARVTTAEGNISSNAAAIVTEQTTRANADTALSNQILALNAKTESDFDSINSWQYDTTVEGFTVSSGTLTWQTNGSIRIAPVNAAQALRTPAGLTINGALYPLVRARVTRVSGTTANARLYWTTAGHGETSGYWDDALSQMPAVGGSAVIEWDMSSPDFGGTDWITSTITRLRFDFGNNSGDVFDIDWIAVGRKAPGASNAMLVAEQTARTSGDTANANAITALTSRVTTAEGDINTVEAGLVTEQTTRANADTAISNNVTALTASTTGADARMRAGITESWITATAHTDNWTLYPGSTGELSLVVDAGHSGQVLSVGNNTGNDTAVLIHKDLIAFDPVKLYKMTIDIKRSLGTGTVYLGYAGYAADGTTLVTATGAADIGGQHFHAASGVAPTTAWTTYTGYTKGFGAPNGDSTASADPLLPKKMHANVRYIRAIVWVNYNAIAGTTLVGNVTISSGEQDVVAANLVTEQTTRANADTAITSSVTALTSRVTTAEGDINTVEAGLVTEQTTRANADTAISNSVTALSATVSSGDIRNRVGMQEQWASATSYTDNWQVVAGTGELSMTTDPGYVGAVLAVGNNSGNDLVSLIHKDLIPFDPTKLYRIQVDLLRTLGTNVAYVGFAGVAADGTTWVNASGVNTSGSQHYHAASAVQPAVWTTYTGYTKGFGASTGDTTASSNPLAPKTMHPNVRYLRLLVYVNYPGGAPGTYLVGRASVHISEEDVVAANLVTEQTTRANADTAISSNVTALTARVTTAEGNITTNASAITTEQTARANADTALSNQLVALTAKTEGGFDPTKVWNFDTTIEGFLGTNNTLSWYPGGYLRAVATTAAPQLYTPSGNTMNGSLFTVVRMRITRVAGTGWFGRLYYSTVAPSTTVHGIGSYYKDIPNPNLAVGQTAVLEWDMTTNSGPETNDWVNATVNQLRWDLTQNAADQWQIDWVAVGRRATPASVQSVTEANAAIVTEQTTRANADSAMAGQITALNALVMWDILPLYQYNFTSTIEGWTAQNATFVWQSSGMGRMTPTAAVAGIIRSPAALTIVGANDNIVRFRITRTAGSGWAATSRIYYVTSGHGESVSYMKTIPDPGLAVGASATIDLDMTALTAGGADWTNNTVTQIRLDFGASTADQFDVDWIAIGRKTQGVSQAVYNNQVSTLVAADSSIASSVTTLASRLETRPNLLKNGGFENGLSSWTLSGGAGATQTFDIPGWGPGFQLTHATSVPAGNILSEKIAATVGETYTLTGDSAMVFATGTGNTIYFDLIFYDASNALILDSTQNPIATTHDFSASDSQRSIHAISVVAPANTAWVSARMLWAGSANTKIGARQIKLERGPAPYTPYSQETTLQVQATTTNGLSAQYTVKIDANNYVTGFGLASTPVNGVPFSTFAVRSDAFYIANPAGPGVAPAMPFIVRTTSTTINGETVPVGVYITDAFIQNGTIVSAKVGNAAITTAKINDLAVTTAKINDAAITTAKIGDAQITTAKIGDAQINAAKIIDATITGAKIAAATIITANIGDAQITGAKIANATVMTANIADAQITNAKVANLAIDNAKIANAAITNAKITGDIYSDNWTGSAGWYIRKSDGVAYFNRIAIYGVVYGSVYVPNNGTAYFIHGTGRHVIVTPWSDSGNVAIVVLDGNSCHFRLDNSAGGTVYYAYV